jgi:uncharacterized protein YlxP (DUF503 family)
MTIGILTLQIHLPGCSSLKEKRSRLKPLLARLHKEFNVSAAEVGHQDVWQDSVIACAVVSNDHKHTQRVLQKVAKWVDTSWPDVDVVSEEIELI